MTMMTSAGDYRTETHNLGEAECARTTREARAMKRLRKAYPSVPEDADLYPDEALIVLHDSRPGLAPRRRTSRPQVPNFGVGDG